MLVLRRYGKVAEDQNEYEYVVYRERLFNHVAGQKLKRDLARRRLRVKARKRYEARVRREFQQRVLIKEIAEGEREGYPDCAPRGGLAKRYRVRFAMKDAEVN